MDRPIEKKKWPLKRIISLVTMGLLIFLVAFMILRPHVSKLKVLKDQLFIVEVKKGKFQEFIPVDGKVEPVKTFYLDAIQGGTVEKIYVEDGALLKKGDTILKLSNASLELEYMNQESRIFDVINNLENTKLSFEQNKHYRELEITSLNYEIDRATLEFDRKKVLYQQSLISSEEYENARREYENLRNQIRIKKDLKKVDSISRVKQIAYINSSVERMKNNLEILKEILKNLYITAPVDGQLSSFDSEIGENKKAGQNLGQIDVLEGFKLSAEIDERYISRTFIGQEADFDYTGNTFDLEISKIYTEVNNGSFKVDFTFTDIVPKGIKRGQTLQLRLKFSGTSDAIIVKRGGFFQETGGNWIYIVSDDGKSATKRNIKIGRQNTTYYEILEGLIPGEKVVVSSYETFGNKDKLIFK